MDGGIGLGYGLWAELGHGQLQYLDLAAHIHLEEDNLSQERSLCRYLDLLHLMYQSVQISLEMDQEQHSQPVSSGGIPSPPGMELQHHYGLVILLALPALSVFHIVVASPPFGAF